MPTVFSPHAIDMMAERNIQRLWVERTLAAPDLVEPDPHHIDRVRAFRALPECEGRVLRVVYVQAGKDVRVIAVFLDRSRSRGR